MHEGSGAEPIIFCRIAILKRKGCESCVKMEERLKALTFLMIAVASLYVFDSISQGGLSGNSVTGLAVSEQDVSMQDVSCYDSDNRDYSVQGTTYARLFKANNEEPKQDVCEGSSLIEYYCVFNEPQVEFYECENGCVNGACRQ